MGKAEAVDGGVRSGRVRAARGLWCGEHPAEGGCEGQGLGADNGVEGVAEAGEGVIDRRPVDAGGEAEAVVCEAGRGEGFRHCNKAPYGGVLKLLLMAEAENPPFLKLSHV